MTEDQINKLLECSGGPFAFPELEAIYSVIKDLCLDWKAKNEKLKELTSIIESEVKSYEAKMAESLSSVDEISELKAKLKEAEKWKDQCFLEIRALNEASDNLIGFTEENEKLKAKLKIAVEALEYINHPESWLRNIEDNNHIVVVVKEALKEIRGE